MKYMRTILLVIAVSMMARAQEQDKHPLLIPGEELKKVSSEFAFTEGPAVDAEGNVFFTDQPNDRILKWSIDGTVSVYLEKSGRSNGLYVDRKGNLISCADQENQLWMISKNKKVKVLVDDFEGKKLNGPNDLWIHPSGGIYFTDPFYKRDYWTRTTKEIEQENVYYFSPNKKKLVIAANGFTRPNGIVGTKDGKKLYVADINAGKIYSYAIQPDGSLQDKTLFTAMGSDGMTIDSEGNVYVTGKGVTIFNASGEKIEHIAVDEPWTANVCFGGKDRQTLFITASKSVYTLKMNVKGIE
jgi:gluconolactonase